MQRRDFETYQKRFKRFRDPAKIFRDPRFSGNHSPSLYLNETGYLQDDII